MVVCVAKTVSDLLLLLILDSYSEIFFSYLLQHSFHKLLKTVKEHEQLNTNHAIMRKVNIVTNFPPPRKCSILPFCINLLLQSTIV